MQRRHFILRLALLPSALLAASARLIHGQPPATPAPPREPWREGASSLARWRRSPRQPIVDSTDPRQRRLLDAIQEGQPLRFRYQGGTFPGTARTISPGLLFTVAGFANVYVSGHCHTRRAERTFAIDGMEFSETTNRVEERTA